MFCNIINKVSILLNKMLYFTYGIFRNPIKNISIWMAFVILWICLQGGEMTMNGKEMFLMATTLVSIMIFISNYLGNQTTDTGNKDNFYLGINIVKNNLYNNFWLQKFSDIPIRLFLWIIVGIPSLILCLDIEFKINWMNKFIWFINNNLKEIKSVWLSVFIVNTFYHIAVLIEAFALAKNNFSISRFYISSREYDKYKTRGTFKSNIAIYCIRFLG